jgi:hypothetical protein
MSDRPASRRQRQRADSHPSPGDEMAVAAAVNTGQEVAGSVAESAATRSGEDVRRRGWFWHWNSIVTQYAPLIGLKGVGLLNSYTVWTDRREESPTRGYAFPSQQSEADFYGEDRAELITINKLLVALDLIEIRKEMVLRVDEQGRRWKVPHNFYRVKDHGDGSSLTARDVLRVAELADRDQAVYRYVRRVFSPRFAPIDRDNVWVKILAEVRETDVWQRLTARTLRDEQRASDRTRAGHANRKGGFGVPIDGDKPASSPKENDSRAVDNEMGGATSVASINNGSEMDVGGTNNGSTADSTTRVAPVNRGRATGVDQTNRTYDQSLLTTTTTPPASVKIEERTPGGAVDKVEGSSHRPVTRLDWAVTGAVGIGPGGQAAPADAPGQEAGVRAFEDANGRRSTPAERQLLRALAERFEPAANEQGRPGRESGWAWVAAAVYEAVEAGSAYVAPRRLREILTRWERDGLPDEADSRQPSAVSPAPKVDGRRANTSENAAGRTRGVRKPAMTQPSVLSPQSSIKLANAPDFELPHGFGSVRTWAFAVSLLSGALEPGQLAELVRGTAIVGYREGEVTIAVPDPAQGERIVRDYGELVARKLGEAMRRPVRIAVLVAPTPPDGERTEATTGPAVELPLGAPLFGGTFDREPEIPSFIVAECGLPSPQVWAAVLDEVAATGDVSVANVDAWLRSTRLIGRGADGSLIVGAVHGLAQRRIASRFAGPLRAAATAILGGEFPLEIVVMRDWLLTNRPPEADPSSEAIGVA